MIRRGVTGGTDELYTPKQLDAAILASLASQNTDFPYRVMFQ